MAHATAASSPGKLKFRALKSLLLSDMDELQYYGEWPRVETLTSCFRERRRRGLTLQKLCIEGYGDGVDVVGPLGSLIKHVRWTEVHEATTDEEDYDDYYDVDQYEEDQGSDDSY